VNAEPRPFRNRTVGGEALAERLRHMSLPAPCILLALPRGGLPTALVVAQRLGLPLDILTVRKLGLPGNPECAIGAVGPGVEFRDDRVLPYTGLTPQAFATLAAAAATERARREQRYRRHLPALDLAGCTAVIVDDGLATGATMIAALRAARAAGAHRVIAAAPVASADALAQVAREADAAVAVVVPEGFRSVGDCYESFEQVDDAQALALLEDAATTRLRSGAQSL